jgi:hypothetical protein
MRHCGRKLVIVALALAATVVGGLPASSTAAGGSAGYKDFAYGTGVSAPTAKEVQSKLWFNDGIWWGVLWRPSTAKYEIFKLDSSSQTWVATGTVVDARGSVRNDAFWNGTKLYVASAGTSETTASQAAKLRRYSYNSSTKTYTVDSGFPVSINTGAGMQAFVITQDSTGMLWATYTQQSEVWVTHSTTSDTTWANPFVLPATGATGILSQDESGIVAYGGNKVGIMWSDQAHQPMHYYWAIHTDGDPDTTWQSTVADQTQSGADNHINLKALNNDPAGQVFAAVKTSISNPYNSPIYNLLVLKSNGTWSKYPIARVIDDWTRGTVLIDPTDREIYVMGASPCCSGGTVYYKVSNLDNISFPVGKGTPLMQSPTDVNINNTTSTKQTISPATGFLGIAGDDTTHNYFHAAFGVGSGDTVPPDTSITSDPTGGTTYTSTATFQFTSTEAGSSFSCNLDGAAFSSCTSPQTYSGLTQGPHTFAVKATDLSGNTDPSPATASWTVDLSEQTVTLNPTADSEVDAASPTANFGTAKSITVDNTPLDDGFLKFSVTGITGAVLDARLRVFLSDGSLDGPAVYAADSTWTETGITWNNRPSRTSGVLDDLTDVTANTWMEYNVTPAVTANGTYAFDVAGTSADGVVFNSRDNPKNKPQLVLTVHPDTTPPETSIVSGPTGTVASTSATFSFSSNEAGSTFACSRDNAAYVACTSPTTYTGLAQGAHTFAVRATDLAGNTDPTPASASWSVDTLAPAAPVILSPVDGTATTSNTLAFSGTAEANSTITVLDGSTAVATATADGGGAWTVTVSGIADGTHVYTATATDSAGNVSSPSSSVSVTVDATPPDTSIDSGPSGTTSSAAATFSFSSTKPGSTFACSLDGTAATSCTSPTTYSGLADGPHTFSVAATDPAGMTDATPATRGWTIDTTPPAAPVITGPADGSAVAGSTVTVQGNAEAAATVEVFDGGVSQGTTVADGSGSWSETLGGVTEGQHVLTAQATDAAGNVSPTSGSVTVTDTRIPAAPVITAPPDGTVEATDAFTVSGTSEAGVTIELFDGTSSQGGTTADSTGAWSISLSGVADGSHSYTAKATNGAGNTSPASAAVGITVDTTPPDTSISSGPSGPTSSTSATFAFTSTESGSTFACSLDWAPFTGCTSPTTYTGLADGSVHTFAVAATDAAGNADASPATRTWTVDVTAPTAPVITSPADGSTSTSRTITVSGTAEAGSTVAVVDGSTSQGTTSADGTGAWSTTLSNVADGSHTYTAKATDAAGNTSAASAPTTITINATAPVTTITSGPSGTVTSTSATFTFTADKPGSTFQCSLDGSAFAACTSPISYTGLSEALHAFQVLAVDTVGNVGAPASRTWTINRTIFSDGFETGNFSAWTSVTAGGDGTATVQNSTVNTGTFAAKFTETANAGSTAYARKSLGSAQTDITVSGDFNVLAEGASGANVPLLRLFDPSGTRLVSVYRQNMSANRVGMNINGSPVSTTGMLALNTWGHFDLHVITAGTASTVELKLNGTVVYSSTTASLGTAGIATIQIGNETAKQAGTVVADNITARV